MTGDSRPDTYAHIAHVRGYLQVAAIDLLRRGHEHDNSKLRPPELEAYDRCTGRLKQFEYGSPEYYKSLDDLGEALEHHYSVADHHPQHFENGVHDMNLIQLLEMLCDWMAAVKRMKNGDIYKSIDINQERFEYGDELKRLLILTVPALGGPVN